MTLQHFFLSWTCWLCLQPVLVCLAWTNLAGFRPGSSLVTALILWPASVPWIFKCLCLTCFPEPSLSCFFAGEGKKPGAEPVLRHSSRGLPLAGFVSYLPLCLLPKQSWPPSGLDLPSSLPWYSDLLLCPGSPYVSALSVWPTFLNQVCLASSPAAPLHFSLTPLSSCRQLWMLLSSWEAASSPVRSQQPSCYYSQSAACSNICCFYQ